MNSKKKIREFVLLEKSTPRKESLQPLTLYTSSHDLINVYSCRSGADNPRGQNFLVNRNIMSLRSFVASLKKSL